MSHMPVDDHTRKVNCLIHVLLKWYLWSTKHLVHQTEDFYTKTSRHWYLQSCLLLDCYVEAWCYRDIYGLERNSIYPKNPGMAKGLPLNSYSKDGIGLLDPRRDLDSRIHDLTWGGFISCGDLAARLFVYFNSPMYCIGMICVLKS